MKKLFLLLLPLIPMQFIAQQSEFYGNFTPTISHLVPISIKDAQPKNVVIKPNFKGRENIEVDNSQTHNIDWVWQQHENTEKSTSASIIWQEIGRAHV